MLSIFCLNLVWICVDKGRYEETYKEKIRFDFDSDYDLSPEYINNP